MKNARHYLRRLKDWGLRETSRQLWLRISVFFSRFGRSLWWGMKARFKMSDAGLLRRTTGEWSTVADLLDSLASRSGSSFLLPHDDPQSTIDYLLQDNPQYITEVLAEADAICENKITLLGREFDFPGGIDWNRDPQTGYRWPVLHRSRMEKYVQAPTRPADLILAWELNRHQHFLPLGIAYWLTGDERYVKTFCAQLESWIRQNPPQHGIHWCVGMEVSIRLVSWMAAFQFFRHSPLFIGGYASMFLKSFWQQADFLSGHMQAESVPNNHILAELAGLALAGTIFPEFRLASAWRETALPRLYEQVADQTHSDGVNREQAAGYHVFVAELLTILVALGRRGLLPQEPRLEKALEGMVDYLSASLTPAGTLPMWGDSHDGRPLSFPAQDGCSSLCSLLATAGVLFHRPEWKFAAGDCTLETFWLLGPKSREDWEAIESQPPKFTSRSFSDAGIYILRDGWSETADAAFFRCGPFGLGGEGHCAHSHCDLLSPILWMRGEPLLVDAGTCQYFGEWRDRFRLTSAHNTVVLDGLDQASPLPDFNWSKISEAKCIRWSDNCVAGSLDYPNSVNLTRELLHPRPGRWEVNDQFIDTANESHTLAWYFHFAPGLALHPDGTSNKIRIEKDGKPIGCVLLPAGVKVEITDSWHSSVYGSKQPNLALTAFWQGSFSNVPAIFSWKFLNNIDYSEENV